MAVAEIGGDRFVDTVKRLCLTALDEGTLLREVAERLRQAVPFDAFCSDVIDPPSGLIINALPEGMGGEKEARLFFEYLYFAQDINDYQWMARSGHLAALLSEGTAGRLDSSLRHRELHRPLGLQHELRAVFTCGSELWGSMDILREAGCRDFSSDELALVRRIAPHVGAGLKMAVLRSRALADSEAPGIAGVLVLDQRGRVSHYTVAAEHWLRELEGPGDGWQEGRGPQAWREGKGLPASIWNVVGALQQSLSASDERHRDSIPRVRVRTRAGRWLTLQASLSEPSADGTSGTVIVIEPAGPRDMLWLNTASYGLTGRETTVVELVLRGLSTREIATVLCISGYTVQEHLSNVFDKVGVRSRKALVNRLFLDNIYPTLFAPGAVS